MDIEVNIDEMKRALRDADMYEPNLSSDELKSYYQVLKNSENTANQEEETRKSKTEVKTGTKGTHIKDCREDETEKETASSSKEKKSFNPKHWSSLRKNTSFEVEDTEDIDGIIDSLNDDADKPKDATKMVFGFNDMLESLNQDTFIRNQHDLKFVPIQCTPKFIRANLETKVKMLVAYHSEINAIKHQLSRQTFFPAPVPRAIVIVNRFQSSLETYDNAETYVSRSGRQTKRKFYSDENSLDEFETASGNKKNKIVDDWNASKKSENKGKISANTSNNNDETVKINENLLDEIIDYDAYTNENNKKEEAVVENVQIEDVTSEPKSVTSEPNARSTPKPIKKLSNSEIMQRSRLFRETPKRRLRSEIMFDKLVENSEKNQKEEKAMMDFEKTLEQIDADEESENDNKTEIDSEDVINIIDEEPIKRRVVPPIPGRRPIHSKRNNSSSKENISGRTRSPMPSSSKFKEDINAIQRCEDVPVPSTSKKRTIRKTVDSNEKSETSASQNDSQHCPICNESFLKDEIQQHAATCGDEIVMVTRSTGKISKITCDICDAVIPLSTEYEVHVRDCIKSKQMEN